MTRPSVRLRLLAGAAVAIFVALAVAWVGMTLLFENHLERRAELELHRDALQLVAGLEAGADGVLTVLQRPSDPRFETPASGLYWQISAADLIFRSRSLWDQALTAPARAAQEEWTTRTAAGPFGQQVLLHERMITPNGSDVPVLVQLAMDYEELRAAGAELGRELALSLAVLWLVLSGAAWIQVQLGLKPLADLPRRLAALRKNARERLGDDFPPEVQPLTRAIDDLANAREADLKRARQRAADLAHGMKTPLAALSAQSRLVREGLHDTGMIADSLDRAIASAAAAVEAELARARASATRHSVQDRDALPAQVARRLITVLERTEKGMRLDYVVECPDELRVAIGEEDLSEILGPLLENAVRFARRQVLISGRHDGTSTLVTIEDDGPGIPESEMNAAMARGRRLDESGGGHGLGLAIARELTEATGGRLSLGKSSLGGLSVELRWPGTDAA
jgi:signal transduction histidine kinase